MKQALRDGVHEFIRVGERFVLVKADEAIELIYSADVVVFNIGLDGVLPFSAFGFPDPLEGWRAADQYSIRQWCATADDPQQSARSVERRNWWPARHSWW